MGNKIKTIAKNSSYVLISNILAGILTLGTNIYIARYLGKDIFGDYSFVIAFISFFIILANLGIDSIVTREISANNRLTEKYINSAITLKLMLSAISIALACIIVSFLPYTQSVKLGVFVTSVTLVLLAGTATISGYFQSRLEMIYVAASNIIAKLIFVLLIFFVTTTNGGFIKLIIASAIGFLFQVVFLLFVLKKRVNVKFCFDIQLNRKILIQSLPLALAGVFVSLYYRVDVLMLSLMNKGEAVGFYSAAYNLTEAPTLISVGFMISMFPLMSRYFKNAKDKLKRSYELSVRYMLVFALPLAVGTTLLSTEIIQNTYGNEYLPSAAALAILIWSTLFVFINIVNGNVLVAIKKQNALSIITGAALAFNILINLWLIPRYGFVGASVATVITEVIYLILTATIIFRNLAIMPLKGITQIALATTVMGAFIYFLKLHFLIEIFGAIFVYIVSLLIFKAITQEDIDIMKKAVGK